MALSPKERLYEELKRAVLTLAIAPGADLDETKLSERYGISRTPLRDVFRQLAGEGYLALRDNRGAMVSPMTHKTMRSFFLVAPMIYLSISRLAAECATAEQILALKDCQARFRGAIETGEIDDRVYWNDRFHLLIGEMADNPYLMPSLRRLLIDHARIGQTFWRARDAAQADRIAAAADQHDQLIALIEAGDAEGAVAVTQEHWALSRDHIELYVRPEPLPIDFSETA